MTVKPGAIQICMAGGPPLYQRQVLEPVLNAFQADPLFAAEGWGLDERSYFAYDEADILRIAKGDSSPYVLQLKRKHSLKHTALLRLNRKPALVVNFHPSTKAKDWPAIFAWAGALAAAYQPQIAWVHIFSAPEPPLEDEEHKRHYLMDASVTGAGPDYENDGPGGLGMRTYLGPDLVKRFGRDRLLRTPAVVSELPWGGVCLDLVEQPWQANMPDLLIAWQATMDALRPAAVFAESTQDEEGNVFFTRAKNW